MESHDSKSSLEPSTNKIKNGIRIIFDTAAGCALYIMVFLVFANAVLRYVFNSGWPFSEEISRWLFVWVSFLGTIVAFKEGKHIGVDLVISRLKEGPRFVLSLIGHIMMCAALALATSGAFRYFMRTYDVPAPTSRLPQGILTISVLIAMAACFVMALIETIKLIRNFIRSRKETE